MTRFFVDRGSFWVSTLGDFGVNFGTCGSGCRRVRLRVSGLVTLMVPNVIPRRARPGLAGLRPHVVQIWSRNTLKIWGKRNPRTPPSGVLQAKSAVSALPNLTRSVCGTSPSTLRVASTLDKSVNLGTSPSTLEQKRARSAVRGPEAFECRTWQWFRVRRARNLWWARGPRCPWRTPAHHGSHITAQPMLRHEAHNLCVGKRPITS